MKFVEQDTNNPSVDRDIDPCYNTYMMKQLFTEVLQATVLAALVFGPLFYYFIFVMKP